ncbi:hypothetical protein SDC9_114580 [bioreactor metagenome]|uniref:Uncharacterized protein n=1 Tax=bioreactor metagenome TaxID=1076179 RepID=A0A645BQK1_9ZZZZ
MLGRFRQQFRIARFKFRRHAFSLQVLHGRFRIAPIRVNIHPPIVFQIVVIHFGYDIFRLAVDGVARMQGETCADHAVRNQILEGEHGLGMRQEHVMVNLVIEFFFAAHFRRVLRRHPAHPRENVLLVDCDPVFHFAAVSLEQGDRVFLEVGDDFPAFPTAVFFLKEQRQIPVIDRHHRLDVVFQAQVDQLVVEIQAFLVHFIHGSWENPCPSDRETIGFQPHFRHQTDIFLHAMVMVDRNITVCVFVGGAGHFHEFIPDRRAFAVLVPRAFHLIGC